MMACGTSALLAQVNPAWCNAGWHVYKGYKGLAAAIYEGSAAAMRVFHHLGSRGV